MCMLDHAYVYCCGIQILRDKAVNVIGNLVHESVPVSKDVRGVRLCMHAVPLS